MLLIFFHPGCGFCREMMPKLSAHFSEGRPQRVPEFSRAQSQGLGAQSQGLVEPGLPIDGKSQLVLITTGDAEQNRQLFGEHKLDCPVLLQRHGEVATAYRAHGTPSGYLISAEGKIASRLAVGAEALLEIARESPSSDQVASDTSVTQPSASNGHGEGQSLVTSAATSRFSNGSLARSKIKRDGLKAGTVAPDFRLPRLDGCGDLALSDLRGKRVLLVFSSPGCGPCNALAPELEKFYGEQRDLEVVMISKGEPKENRAKVKKHDLTFPIVLQQQWEISRLYAMFSTPIAYLIDERGTIARDVAIGVEPIQELMTTATRMEYPAPVLSR